MEAIKQIYEKLPRTIPMPPEMLNHCAEVIILSLEGKPHAAESKAEPEESANTDSLKPTAGPIEFNSLQELDEQDLEAKAAQLGLKLEEVADLHGLKFLGCLPDFPERAPQGEYPVRPELELL